MSLRSDKMSAGQTELLRGP